MQHFPLTRALQLTISKDRRGIGVASHMGRGSLLFQGRPTVGLHCTVGTTHKVKQWQCTHTLTVLHGLLKPHEHVIEVFSPIVFEFDKSLGNMYTHIMHMHFVSSCHFESKISPTC